MFDSASLKELSSEARNCVARQTRLSSLPKHARSGRKNEAKKGEKWEGDWKKFSPRQVLITIIIEWFRLINAAFSLPWSLNFPLKQFTDFPSNCVSYILQINVKIVEKYNSSAENDRGSMSRSWQIPPAKNPHPLDSSFTGTLIIASNNLCCEAPSIQRGHRENWKKSRHKPKSRSSRTPKLF